MTLEKKIPLHGDGSYVRSWLHVEDTCSAIFYLLANGKLNRIYNVAGNYEASNREVISKVLASYFKKKVRIEPYVKMNYVRMGEDVRYSLDDSSLRHLGWKNHKQFDREIKAIVHHYRSRFVW